MPGLSGAVGGVAAGRRGRNLANQSLRPRALHRVEACRFHIQDAEALRHGLVVFTETTTLCDGLGYDELWKEHIMARMAWNNLPALHQIIHFLTAGVGTPIGVLLVTLSGGDGRMAAEFKLSPFAHLADEEWTGYSSA